jgi:hypothetical protein
MRAILAVLLRVRCIGFRRFALFTEAVLWLLLLRLAMATIPFRHIVLLVGTCVIPTDVRVRRLLDMRPAPADLPRARAVSWAVDCAARHVPFTTACLHHAIAARFMLRRRSIPTVMHLGACKENRSQLFAAHAWVVGPGLAATGYPGAGRFVPIVSFL